MCKSVLAEPGTGAGSGEAGAALVVVGEGAFDDGPERGCVAWLADVDEFVDDDVIELGRRGVARQPSGC
jgi:hypothetical protein